MGQHHGIEPNTTPAHKNASDDRRRAAGARTCTSWPGAHAHTRAPPGPRACQAEPAIAGIRCPNPGPATAGRRTDRSSGRQRRRERRRAGGVRHSLSESSCPSRHLIRVILSESSCPSILHSSKAVGHVSGSSESSSESGRSRTAGTAGSESDAPRWARARGWWAVPHPARGGPALVPTPGGLQT